MDTRFSEVSCANCNTNFKKLDKEIEKTNNNFCSRSCAAQVNNKRFRKRRTKPCRCGGERLNYKQKFCNDCRYKFKQSLIDNQTIEEATQYYSGLPAGRYTRIRCNARAKALKNFSYSCQNCSYSKYVECCHKKAISEYPKDTLVKEVNNLSNLILLCPNCHWEFDEEILIMEEKIVPDEN